MRIQDSKRQGDTQFKHQDREEVSTRSSISLGG